MAEPAILQRAVSENEFFSLLVEPDSPKHGYANGNLLDASMMSGGGVAHAELVSNLMILLGSAVKERSCRVFESSMMVRAEATQASFFPDVSVVCGEPSFGQNQGIAYLLNPLVVVEVLSPSTESKDRGLKFENYMLIDSLQEYVLVSSLKRRVEVFSRMDQQWKLTVFSHDSQSFEIASLDLQVSMNDLYDRVKFEDIG